MICNHGFVAGPQAERPKLPWSAGRQPTGGDGRDRARGSIKVEEQLRPPRTKVELDEHPH